MFEELLVASIPFIIPAILVASFIYNTKTPVISANPSKKQKDNRPKEKKRAVSEPQQTQQTSTTQQQQSQQNAGLDAPLSDADMTE